MPKEKQKIKERLAELPPHYRARLIADIKRKKARGIPTIELPEGL